MCQCTQADRGLETLEDLLGEIEVELARIAEEEAPPLLEDEEGEANARANAAIKVQRAFHEKQARRAALAHKKQMNALRYARAVRTVSRTAFGFDILMKSVVCGCSLTYRPFCSVAERRCTMSPSFSRMFSIIQYGR